jgi:hypothetical protein
VRRRRPAPLARPHNDASCHFRVETGAEQPEAEAAPTGRRQRASSFGAAAAQYARYRPGYAEAAIRWCLAPVGEFTLPLVTVVLRAGRRP